MISLEISIHLWTHHHNLCYKCIHHLQKFSLTPYIYLFREKFQSNFKFTTKLIGRYKNFPYTTCPYMCLASSIINIPHQSGSVQFSSVTQVHLLQLNLHWHIIIIQRSQLTLELTCDIVHSMILNKCINHMHLSL